MKSVLRMIVPALFMLALLSGCVAARQQAVRVTAFDTTVRVSNRHWLSMTIYAWGQSQRVRLGRLGAGKTTIFVIPPMLLRGATPLRFVMEPEGPSPAMLSEEIIVSPDEQVILIIPNTR